MLVLSTRKPSSRILLGTPKSWSARLSRIAGRWLEPVHVLVAFVDYCRIHLALGLEDGQSCREPVEWPASGLDSGEFARRVLRDATPL